MLMNAELSIDRFANFERKLRIAQTALLRRQRELTVSATMRRAATFGLPLAAAATLAAFCKTLGWIPSAFPWVLCGVSVLVLALCIGRGLWLCWNAKADLVDTAERMDHAAGNKNRFAAALEFRQLNLTGGFADLAIDDALAMAGSMSVVPITLPGKKSSPTVAYELTAMILCLLACAVLLFLPARLGSGKLLSRAIALSGQSNQSPLPMDQPNGPAEIADAVRDRTPLSAPAAEHADQPTGVKTSGTPAIKQPQAAPSSVAAAESASPAGDSNGQGSSPGRAPGSPSTPSPSVNRMHALAAIPSLATDVGDDQQSKNANSGSPAAAGAGDEVRMTGESDSQNPSDGQNHDNKSAKNGKEGNTDGGSSSNQHTDSKGTAHNAQGMENTDSTGGHGSGSGQSGGKKSRGARTTLLGIRTPDLFKGQDHPGPEQQTFLPADPTPNPQVPAGTATAAPRHADEQIQNLTQVDPDDDVLINQYFTQLHMGP